MSSSGHPSIREAPAASHTADRAAPPEPRPKACNPYRSRRTHRKSRKGCVNCKGRKIKCDELKPQCWQCIRHGLKCDFVQSDASSTSSSSKTPPAAQTAPPVAVNGEDASLSSPKSLASSHSQQRTPSATASTAPSTPCGPGIVPRLAFPKLDGELPLNLTDLSLLHHYTVITSSSLYPWSTELQSWWRYEVPRVAFQHPFVMRSLLALTGLHVAHSSTVYFHGRELSPGDRDFHVHQALTQHQLAGQTATAILDAGHVTEETSAPLYVFSVVTMLVSMAVPRKARRVLLLDDAGAIEWARLMRGAKTIVDLGRTWIQTGGLGLALKDDIRPETLWTEQEKQAFGETRNVESIDAKPEAKTLRAGPNLSHLRHFIASSALAEGEHGEGGDDEEQHLSLQALDKLQHIFSVFLEHGESVQTVRLIFSWLCAVDFKYLELVSQHKPHAMLVFSYFAVLLYWIDRVWWLEDWGMDLVAGIVDILGEEYHEWLKWPKEQLGLLKD